MDKFHRIPIYMNEPGFEDIPGVKQDLKSLPIMYAYMKNITSIIPHCEYKDICSAINDSDAVYVPMSADELYTLINNESSSQIL